MNAYKFVGIDDEKFTIPSRISNKEVEFHLIRFFLFLGLREITGSCSGMYVCELYLFLIYSIRCFI